MVLVDANVLLYAYNQDSPSHAVARAWLESEISSGRPVRLALEHGAVVASTDRDFDRFDGIKTINPLL